MVVGAQPSIQDCTYPEEIISMIIIIILRIIIEQMAQPSRPLSPEAKKKPSLHTALARPWVWPRIRHRVKKKKTPGSLVSGQSPLFLIRSQKTAVNLG